MRRAKRLQRPWIHVAGISGGTSQWDGAGSLVRRRNRPTATGRPHDVLPCGRASAHSMLYAQSLMYHALPRANRTSGAIDSYVGRCTTRMPQRWAVSQAMQGYSGLPNRCWLSPEPGSAAIMEESRFWRGNLSGSLRPAKNLPLDRVGRWDGTLRRRRHHRGPVFPSGRSGISATPGRRCGLIRCANWRWCCYLTGYIRAEGTRRLRSSALVFTTWYIGSLCLRDSRATLGPGNRARFLFRRDTSCL